MLDERQAIADLEAELEQLRDAADPCRKIAMAAKVAMVAGVAALVLAFLQSSPMALVIGIATSLSSIALLGSNEQRLRELLERSCGGPTLRDDRSAAASRGRARVCPFDRLRRPERVIGTRSWGQGRRSTWGIYGRGLIGERLR